MRHSLLILTSLLIIAAAVPLNARAQEAELININTADEKTLTSLPGIGEVIAARIIDHRTRNGLFTTIDELTKISGIGAKKLDTIRDLVTVGDPDADPETTTATP